VIPRQANCILAIARLADYFKVAVQGKQRMQTFPKERLIVYQ
jgi:hypothetical protein